MRLNRRNLLQTIGLGAITSTASQSALGADCAPPPRADLPGPLRLIANENPYGPSPKAREAMLNSFDESHRYAIRARMELEGLIATEEDLPKNNVFVTAGSGEALRMAALHTALQNKKVLAADPTFEMLQPYAENTGAEVIRVPLNADYVHDLEAMEAAITNDVGLVYICNPNNPTGTLLDPNALRDFCKRASKKALVLVDEAYAELTEDPTLNSMVDLVRSGENVMVLRTFSKLHGMAGLRVGYGLASQDAVKAIKKYQMSVPNTLGLRAAIASLQDKEFQAFSKERIITGRNMVMDTCTELGLAFAPSNTNFVFFDAGMPASDLSSEMRKRNIQMRGVQGFETKCRVSVGTVEQMALFTKALKEIKNA